MIDLVFVLNSVINSRLKEKNGRVYTCFSDFKTVFNLVNREVLKGKMEGLGIKGKFVRAIESIYQKTYNEIITGEGISKKFRNENE